MMVLMPWRSNLLLLALFAAFASLLFPAQEKNRQQDFNVLLITVDTLRFDRVGILDPRHVKTPNLDALAKKSLIFSRAFAHNPVTLPSHTNILTGTTPLSHGISDNTGFKLDKKFLTLPKYLQRQGYRTAAFIGAFPLDSRFGLDQGFDLYDDYYGTHNDRELFFVERSAEKVITPAMAWIGKQPQKWFGWIHLFDPHQPYLPPSPYKEKYAADLYSGEVAYVDAQLGVLFDFLNKKRLLEKTVIILTADHGEALGEKGEETHSYFAYNNTIHVPLFVRIPGRKPETFAKNVCHADIFPTVCSVLGLKIPPGLQGESLLDILASGGRKNPEIYFESLTAYLNRDWAPLRGMISGNSKFIDLPIKEVYDLKSDFSEMNNLAGGSKIGQLKDSLNRLIKRLKSRLAPGRENRMDPEVQKRLKALGYISESRSEQRKKQYNEQDDLKTLLPLQNKMLSGVALFHTGDLLGAEKMIREVIAASPSFILAYKHLSSMYRETGKTVLAIAILEQGLEKNPGDIRLLSKLGIVLADSGKWQRAVSILELCIRQEDFDPENFNFLGIAYYKGGDFAKALKNYGRALELDRNNASVYNNIGSVHLQIFLRGRDLQAFALAEMNFKKALEIDRKMFAACNGLGAAYKKVGRNTEAISYWRQALAIKPDYDLPLVNLGITLLEEGRAGEALDCFLNYREKFSHKIPLAERARVDRLIVEARAKLEPTG
ncbi:MAG: sulfatase-like hydrolase/transferase [Candidatus Aminicenantes bacterium]|nr:sulfatase-like hydrolase/transferase [Candidatus Aminicenantes bacterium]